MQIKFKAKNIKLILSIVLAVILLGASAYMVVNNFFASPEPEPGQDNFFLKAEEGLAGAGGLGGIVGEAERDRAKTLLDGLVKFGDWPVVVDLESLGRSNPFLPVF